MSFKILSDRKAVLGMSFHAEIQCFQPLKEQPGVERTHGRTRIPQGKHPGAKNERQITESLNKLEAVV